MELISLIDKLMREHSLTREEWLLLIKNAGEKEQRYASELARAAAVRSFGKRIYIRGIIEFSSYCKNDCCYCGLRNGNKCAARYRLTEQDIYDCCREGHENGIRTFVLQGGEDGYFTDERLIPIIRGIKERYPDSAVTLSLGERSAISYKALYEAGADRYLLRHETADKEHYKRLHPEYMSWDRRMQCLRELKAIGYQTGCGMMVGSPYQTDEALAADMLFMERFRPHMAGIGPFIPHKDTPFAAFGAGSVNKTLFMLSLTRLMLPSVLLPSTTALGTASRDGRMAGVLAGCNVIMPNLSPIEVRKKYMLYDNKAGVGMDAKTGIAAIAEQLAAIGYEAVTQRGDYKEIKE